MGWEIPPGHVPMVIITPEQYLRFVGYRGPSVWPVYFGARVAMHAIQNIAMNAMVHGNIGELQKNLDVMLRAGFDIADKQAAAGPTGSEDILRLDIERLETGLYDNWKAGVWHGVGSAYANAMDNFLRAGQLIYAYKTLAYHTAVTPRMRRHWNSLFTPMEVGGSQAWVLYRRGALTEGQFYDRMAWDGWSKENAALLTQAMEHLPNPREAFYLWVKGQLTEDQRDALYFAGGFNTEWHPLMTENYYYTPSIYDLTRIADYVEIDQIWAIDQMKRRGLRDRDIAKIWEMLEIRPLREERRWLTSKALYCRQHGYWSHDGLDDYWVDLEVKPKERELLNEYGDLLYEVEVLEERIEVLRWRFRTADISEADFLAGLVALGIDEVKANLMVEVEKAKGYFGYIYPGAA